MLDEVEYETLADCLVATLEEESTLATITIHQETCTTQAGECTCSPFRIPASDIYRHGAEAVARKLEPPL